MESKTLAYFGAIVDGEGSLIISKCPKQYKSKINVTSTDKILTDSLLENFGGKVYISKAKSNRKIAYHWELTSYKNINEFLQKIISHLLIKKEQANLLLQFAERRENILKKPRKEVGYTLEDTEIYRELKRLKQEYPKELPPYKFTEEEKLSYLAGLVDGEGSVEMMGAVHKNLYGNTKLILTPVIRIANTDQRIMEFLTKEFGGFVRKRKGNEKHKDLYQWQMSGLKEDFFNNLKGRLLIKNDRLDLVLEYLKLRKNGYVHNNEEIEIYLKIRKLNKKGKGYPDARKLLEYTKLVRSPRKFFVEKKELENLYMVKKLSIRQIAKMYNVQFGSVRLRLKKEGISLRTFREGRKLHPPKLTEAGRIKMSEKASKSRKEAWKNPEYRKKMEKALTIARSKRSC